MAATDTGVTSVDHILHVTGDRTPHDSKPMESSPSVPVVPLVQKLLAELIATYFFIFAGCASILVNLDRDKIVTFPGIALVWGLALMVMIYSVGHISGAHLDPAVTIAFAVIKKFPWKQVPAYVAVQIAGATMANGTLRLLFSGHEDLFVGTVPSGSNLQSFIVEFIISFYLMFVVCGVATDNRAIGELAGLAIGSTIIINVLFAGPISGSSMNPARSLGSAIVWHKYTSIWIYLTAPVLGCTVGALSYSVIRYTQKPVREIIESGSFLKGRFGRR